MYNIFLFLYIIYGRLIAFNPGDRCVPYTGPPIMDIMGGIHFTAGILAALHQRDRTGCGLQMETSLFESAIAPLTAQISAYRAHGGK